MSLLLRMSNRWVTPAGGGSVPSSLSVPTISGTAQVGATLATSNGTWTHSPTGYAYQWQRSDNGTTGWSDISGATSSTYAAVVADEAKYLRAGVVPSNAAGSGAIAYSAASAQVVAAGAAVDVTTFQVTSPSSATLPWAFGHAFRQGDIPIGMAIVSPEATFASAVRTRWPDGSVRHAMICGRATLTANTPKTITLQRGAAPGGTNVALSALQSAITAGQHTVSLGSFGTVDLHTAVNATSSYTAGNVGNKKWSAGLVRTRTSTPVMSEWHFYSPAPSDEHLAVWWFVRRWATGETQIRIVVESGWLKVGSPTEKVYAPVITLGGTSRYAPGSITHLHHTRWRRVLWLDAAMPEVVPTHLPAYARSTKCVPNYYSATVASGSDLDGYAQSVVPFAVADHEPAMGSGGDAHDIGVLPHWEALYCTTGDARVFRATIANAEAIGRYGLFYRDETTQRPINITSYPNLALPGTNSGIGGTSGDSPTSDFTPTPAGGALPTWTPSHHPSPGYLPYLLTDDFEFLEQQMFAATAGYLRMYVSGEYEGRFGSQGIFNAHRTQVRDAAWSLRTLGLAVASMDSTDALASSYQTWWANNVGWYRDQAATGPWADNIFGIFKYDADYNTGSSLGETAPWQFFFFHMAMSFAADAGVPMDDATATKFSTLIAHLHKHPVGFLGDGSGSSMPFRRGSQYYFPYLTAGADLSAAWASPSFYASWAAAYTALLGVRGWGALGAGTDLRVWDSDASADGYSLSDFAKNSGWGQLMGALAAAVDAGAAGAVAAWNRVAGSTTWAAKVGAFAANPKYGIVPRVAVGVPTWLAGASVNAWTQLANTTLPAGPTQTFGGGGSAGPVAYSGMALREATSTLIVWGGGHADYDGNEVRALDLRADVPAWAEICSATPVGQRTSQAPWWGAAPNQKPNVPHTYSSLVWVESRTRMFATGRSAMSGPSGGDVDSELIALAWPGTGLATWDQPGSWSSEGTIRARVSEADNSGNVWMFKPGQVLTKWVPSTRAITDYSIGALNWSGYGAVALDTTRNRFLRIAGYSEPIVLVDNLSGTPTVTTIATSTSSLGLLTGASAAAFVAKAQEPESAGLVYDPINDRYLLFTGTGGAMYAVNASTWAVTVVSPTNHASLPNPPGYGVHSRVRYVPALQGIFYQPLASSSAWFLRLA